MSKKETDPDAMELTTGSRASAEGGTLTHVPGAKDDYKVEVQFSTARERWPPTNPQIFKLMKLWFISEDVEFGGPGRYGRRMPWWYITQICRHNEEVAFEALGVEGQEARTHFEKSVVEHADETIEMIEYLKEDCEKSLREKGEL